MGSTRTLKFPAVWMLLCLGLASCGGGGADVDALQSRPILEAVVPGFVDGYISEISDGDDPSVTKLYEVDGSWESASVALAGVVRQYGWQIERINCVGTGNDVIARREVEGTWLLLQSGTGTRGAGMILSVDADQGPTAALTVGGSCPQALIDAAQP